MARNSGFDSDHRASSTDQNECYGFESLIPGFWISQTGKSQPSHLLGLQRIP